MINLSAALGDQDFETIMCPVLRCHSPRSSFTFDLITSETEHTELVKIGGNK
jgi:hypothetical protein